MSLQVGIVGLPNVGKSTLYNALTRSKAESANYPFCTIDKNVGVVSVPDPRLNTIAQLIIPDKTVPTTVEFVDIAGLVRGASQGAGLGNQFLSHIRETDAIAHVVRCFDDENIVHVDGSVDPLRDISTVTTELLLADMQTVDNRLKRIEKTAKTSKDRKMLQELSLLKRISALLDEEKPARLCELQEEEEILFRQLQLLTAKPVLYVCNVDENDLGAGGNQWTEQVAKLAASENCSAILVSGALEADMADLTSDEQAELLKDLGVEGSGLDRLIRAAYQLLGLETFFTAGKKEVRAWTVRQGTKAPQAAGVIHTDFERGFIRAETYHCEDLFSLGSETKVREAGRYRSEGKDYVVRDGDVILFRFNV